MKKYGYVLLFLLTILFIAGCSGKKEPVRMYYYYFNACGSCNESGKFYEMANAQLKGIDSSDYEIITVNIFKDSMPESLKQFLSDNSLRLEDISYPMLTSGKNYIMGQEEIKQGIRNLLKNQIDRSGPAVIKGNRNALKGYATQPSEEDSSSKTIQKTRSYFVYFYTSSCDDCKSTQGFFEALPQTYWVKDGEKTILSELRIDKKNITQRENLTQLQGLFEYYKVPQSEREVPILFYTKGYISGYSNIKNNFERVVKGGKALNFDISRLSLKDGVSGLTAGSLPGIFLTGLINGLNPCSISMLFLLLSLVISKQENILKVGFTYIFGKIVAYFSFGVATYSIISLVDSALFKKLQFFAGMLLVLLSLVLALLNFRDAYYAKKERYKDVKMQLPGILRKYNHMIIHYFLERTSTGVNLVLVFILGLIISLGEFLCTGQIYVATIIYLFQNTQNLTGITVASFVLYVSAIAIPLLVLVLLANRVKKLLLISEFIRKYLPLIKVLSGITFLVFSVLFFVYVY